jgi:hypothetical protein
VDVGVDEARQQKFVLVQQANDLSFLQRISAND